MFLMLILIVNKFLDDRYHAAIKIPEAFAGMSIR